MLIQHKQVGNKGIFFVSGDDNILAELVYTMASPLKMIIEHTEVDPSLEGKGIGKQLVETAVEYARTHKMKIIPLCTFTKAVMDRRPDLRDVL